MIFTFDTHGGDSCLNYKTGESCTIKKAIPLNKYDFPDIGFMYLIEFEDGLVIEAFSDELTNPKIIKDI